MISLLISLVYDFYSLLAFAIGLLRYLLLIAVSLFGLALFRVPTKDSFEEWLQEVAPDDDVGFRLMFILQRRFLPDLETLRILSQWRFYNLGCCRLAVSRFGRNGRDREEIVLGVFGTWVVVS